MQFMEIGIPKEIKIEETRVAITPSGVAALVAHGHQVLIEQGAGAGSSIPDALYQAAGAHILPSARAVWEQARLILKVKEPLPVEYPLLRPGLIVFTYLHLAAEERLTRVLCEKQVTALGYETIQLDDGSLPLLAPMSEVAGRLAIQVGGWCLQAQNGGRGVLLSGASGAGTCCDHRGGHCRRQRLSGGGRSRRPGEHSRRQSGPPPLCPRYPGRACDDRDVEPGEH